MTLDQLRYFLETAKFEHLGKAARSLHISPSAVSAAIAALEEEFKIQLFERQGKGLRLTDKGQAFRRETDEIFDRLAKFQQSMSASPELTGLYRIGASQFLANHFLAKAWTQIQSRHSEVAVELNSLPTVQVVNGVHSGALDGGLCFSPLRLPDLRAIELYAGQMIVAVRRGHPLLKAPARERLKLLSKYPAAIHKAAQGVDVCEDHPMFEKFGIETNIRCFWDSDDVAIEAVRGSDAWGMFPDIVMRDCRDLQVLEPPSGWHAPTSIAFVVRAHRAENPVLKLFVDQLRALLK